MTPGSGRFAALAMTLLVVGGGLAGCDWLKGDAAPKADRGETDSTAAASQPAASGARPAYASAFPGARPVDPSAPTPSGGTGLVTFTTDAAPAEVVQYYRARAEQAGLTQVASMDQGAARAYGAEDKTSGDSLQVIATPEGVGSTTVQLSWTAG